MALVIRRPPRNSERKKRHVEFSWQVADIVFRLEKLLRIKLNLIGLWLQDLRSFLPQLPVVKMDTFMQLGKYTFES